MKKILLHPLFQFAVALMVTALSACITQDPDPQWMQNAQKTDEDNGAYNNTQSTDTDYGVRGGGGRGNGRR